ncbi:hypothetical protein PCE1_000193 [Barthelona sp. PCE]
MSQPQTGTTCVQSHKYKHPFNSHVFPVFLTSTFSFDSVAHGSSLFNGEAEGHIYSRLANPTVQNTEHIIAESEGGKFCLGFSSGMAAISASLFANLKAGDEVVMSDCVYGCTVSLSRRFEQYGIKRTIVDMGDVENVKNAITDATKIVYFETPANPNLKVVDIEEVAKIAHENNCLCIVDNTFTTPIFCNPLSLGADIVVHSGTKYLNGHGDLIFGAAVMNDAEMFTHLMEFRVDFGALLSPSDAHLIARGMRTLPLRMMEHYKNGLAVAHHLEAHPKVKKVWHPCLESHPGYAVHTKQSSGYGSTFSFEMECDESGAVRFVEAVKIFTNAVSLGCTDSLLCVPALTTHSGVPEEEKIAAGIHPGLVRLHVGLEHIDDIIADLDNALSQV